MIVEGRARSGKTSLLEFISAFLGTSKHFSYPKLSGSPGRTFFLLLRGGSGR